MLRRLIILLACTLLLGMTSVYGNPLVKKGGSVSRPEQTFQESVLTLLIKTTTDREQGINDLLARHAIPCDWICQDTGLDIVDFLNTASPETVLRAALTGLLENMPSNTQDATPQGGVRHG